MSFWQKWKQWLIKKKLWEFLIYTFFGVLASTVDITVHFLCLKLLGFHYMPATIISWIVANLFSFVANKHWVFHSNRETFWQAVIEFGRFIFYRLLSLGIDMGSMFVLMEWTKVGNLPAKILTQIILGIVNYLSSKFLIFSKRKKDKL